ncbi:MAG: hypothetical protein EF813_06955 [Methanosarcinales archaeon]|nr:MAG: hypothetical protein EF813_06955 [Methanosarcinales archaeon]
MAVSGAYQLQSSTSKRSCIFGAHRPAFQEISQGLLRISTKRSQNHEQKRIVKYVARYIRHPAVANTQLNQYDGKTVTFWYGDHGGTRHFVPITVREFIQALIQHIPDRNFKMIRCYGAYSRRIKGK